MKHSWQEINGRKKFIWQYNYTLFEDDFLTRTQYLPGLSSFVQLICISSASILHFNIKKYTEAHSNLHICIVNKINLGGGNM
jgi:hypothetical protein